MMRSVSAMVVYSISRAWICHRAPVTDGAVRLGSRRAMIPKIDRVAAPKIVHASFAILVTVVEQDGVAKCDVGWLRAHEESDCVSCFRVALIGCTSSSSHYYFLPRREGGGAGAGAVRHSAPGGREGHLGGSSGWGAPYWVRRKMDEW